MNESTRVWSNRHIFVAVLTCCVVGLAGCGDVSPDGEDSSEHAVDEGMTPDDCADDEQFNPATNDCVQTDDEDPDAGGGDGGDDGGDSGGDDGGDDGGQGGDGTEEECGPGSIVGQTCRPDGGILPGADVVVEGYDCDGDPFQQFAVADGSGHYEFESVPSGEHTLTITSGSFEITDEITVNYDSETDLTSQAAKICLEGDEADIAVLDGMFDDVDLVLEDMGVEFDYFPGGSTLGEDGHELVTDIDKLREYDILFIECQVDKPTGDEESVALDNLRRFVELGNSVYASDRAHPWIYMAFPDAIDFALPDYDDDTLRSDIQTGSPGGQTGTYTADVVSDEMYTLLGTDTVDFHFDTGSWTITTGDGAMSRSHFELEPDLWGSGDDLDSPASVVTTYDDPISNGRIIYTSFHNSAQDQLDGEMAEIMEYMIFQL